jgi:hypothetical protein
MQRRDKLFSYAAKLTGEIRVIMIQINEAHSHKWKIGMDKHPSPQQDFCERVCRAQDFLTKYKVPYDMYIDNWDNDYENAFHAWPDKYYLVGKDLKVLAKSEYGTEGAMDGKLLVDPTDILEGFVKKA